MVLYKSKKIQNIGILLGSICFALVFAEGVVRITRLAPAVHSIRFNRKSQYRLSNNPIMGYEFKERFRDYKANGYLSYPYINSYGQRDIERAYEKPAGVKRIIILGDSVVAGLGMRNLDHTVSRQLEKLLKENKNNVEVLNFGVNGYCTKAEVEMLREKGLKYSPDIVILTFVYNDYDNFNNDILGVSFDRSRISKFLFMQSHLFRLICLRMNFFNYKKQFELQKFKYNMMTPLKEEEILQIKKESDSAVGRHLGVMGENNVVDGIKSLKKLSQEYNFETFIIILPYITEDAIVDVESYNVPKIQIVDETTELAIERIAKEFEIPTFRISNYFKEDFSNKIQVEKKVIAPRFFYSVNPKDSIHLSYNGNQIVALAIRDIIRLQGFLHTSPKKL